LLLGFGLGLCGGYYNYIQSPAVFISSAKIQIVEPITQNLRIQGIELSRGSRSLTDEALVIRGENILRKAAEIGGL